MQNTALTAVFLGFESNSLYISPLSNTHIYRNESIEEVGDAGRITDNNRVSNRSDGSRRVIDHGVATAAVIGDDQPRTDSRPVQYD